MNLPNLLSLFRLCLTAFFILAMTYQRYTLALVLFVAQAISDLLDGFFARMMHKKTDLGAWLDPIADKVMLVSSYLVFGFQQIILTGPWRSCSCGILFLCSASFFYICSHIVLAPSPTVLGKATTVFQMVTILYLLWSTTRSSRPTSIMPRLPLPCSPAFSTFCSVLPPFPAKKSFDNKGLFITIKCNYIKY